MESSDLADYSAIHVPIPAGRIIPTGGVLHSVEVVPGVIIDYGEGNEIVGVELVWHQDINLVSSVLTDYGVNNADIGNIKRAMGEVPDER